MKNKLLYVVASATQYQAPWSRVMAQDKRIHVSTLFYEDRKIGAQFDAGFGQAVQWDVPLLEGYPYQYLSEVAGGVLTSQKLVALWKIIDAKKFDIVWAHGYTDIYTIAAILFAKMKGLTVFVRGDSALFPDAQKILKRKIIFYILDKFVDRYLTVGTENKKFYQRFGVSEKKMFMCGYAVDNDFFREKALAAKNNLASLKKELNMIDERPIILFASKFSVGKRPMDLMQAYLQLAKNNHENAPYLIFIGTGETFDAVKTVSTKNNLEHVRFLGFKNQTELPAYFALADILVLPSMYEKWGLIINESMNAECAIITTNYVGCRTDLVKPGENGFIYPAKDVDALAHCLKMLIENRELREKMKKKSGEIIATWGLQESVDGIVAACESLENRQSPMRKHGIKQAWG